MLKLKRQPSWERSQWLTRSLEAITNIWKHSFVPLRHDYQNTPQLPWVDDNELQEVLNAEDDLAYNTHSIEDDDLFDAHYDHY